MKLFSLITLTFLSLNITAGDGDPKTSQEKYCAKVKDGKLTVMHEGNPITGTVTLTNGMQIMTDGTILNRDGTKLMLKEGECVDKDGKLMKEITGKDTKNESKK
jgi:hypothetical protein